MRVTCEITTPEQLITFLAKMQFDVDLCEKAMQAQIRSNGASIYVMYDSDTRTILEVQDSNNTTVATAEVKEQQRKPLRKLVRTNTLVG